MLGKLPQQLADGRKRQTGLFGQAAGGVRRLFRAARYVRHQHNAIIRQFIESEHRLFRATQPYKPAAEYNTNPVLF